MGCLCEIWGTGVVSGVFWHAIFVDDGFLVEK
jgi:hypothetical protein